MNSTLQGSFIQSDFTQNGLNCIDLEVLAIQGATHSSELGKCETESICSTCGDNWQGLNRLSTTSHADFKIWVSQMIEYLSFSVCYYDVPPVYTLDLISPSYLNQYF